MQIGKPPSAVIRASGTSPLCSLLIKAAVWVQKIASVSVELVSAASLTKTRRSTTPSSDRRFKTKAVCAVGEKAPLAKKRSASFSLTPIPKRYLRFKALRSLGDFSRSVCSSEFDTCVVVSPIPAAPPMGSVASEKVAPPAKAALAISFSSCCKTGLLL